MNIKTITILLPLLLLTTFHLSAQVSTHWTITGNMLSNPGFLGSNNSFPVIFRTNGVERGRVTPAGLWGFGVLSPSAKVSINTVVPNQDGLRVQVDNATRLIVNSNGKVGVGTPSPQGDLHVDHSATGLVGGVLSTGFRLSNKGVNNQFWNMFVANSNGNLELWENNTFMGQFSDENGGYFPVSDFRLKKDIEKVEQVLPQVLQLQVKKYHLLHNATADKKHYGLIAQEVEKIFPEFIQKTKHDGSNQEVYTMDYSAFGVVAIKAIQEMQQTMVLQQQQNLLQQQKIADLEEKFAQLEKAVKTGANFDLSNLDLLGTALEQNQPNPVTGTTTFRYRIPTGSTAQIIVFDGMTGQKVRTLDAPVGGQIEMNGSDLKEGTYIYSLIVNGKLAASKHLLLKK